MDNYAMIRIADIKDNIEDYMKIISEDPIDSKDIKDLEFYYSEWVKCYCDLGTATINDSMAVQAHLSALRTHKIDPYIAGGAASGLAGAGAGLMAGVSAGARNKQIDEARNYWAIQSAQTGATKSMAEGKILAFSDAIIKIIQKYPEADKIHHEAITKGYSYFDENAKRREEKKIEAVKSSIFSGLLVMAFFMLVIVGITGKWVPALIISGTLGFAMLWALLESGLKQAKDISNDPPLSVRVNSSSQVNLITKEEKDELIKSYRMLMMDEKPTDTQLALFYARIKDLCDDPDISKMSSTICEEIARRYNKKRKIHLIIIGCIVIFAVYRLILKIMN